MMRLPAWEMRPSQTRAVPLFQLVAQWWLQEPQLLKNWSPWIVRVHSLTPGNKIRCSAFTWENSPMASVQTNIWELSPRKSQTVRSQLSRLRRNRVLAPAWMVLWSLKFRMASRALLCLHSVASLRLSKWGPLNIMLSRKQIIWPTLPLCPCRSENTFPLKIKYEPCIQNHKNCKYPKDLLLNIEIRPYSWH